MRLSSAQTPRGSFEGRASSFRRFRQKVRKLGKASKGHKLMAVMSIDEEVQWNVNKDCLVDQ